MPSRTKKQARTMAGAAHDPTFAERMNIPQKVAKEFHRADVRKAGAKKARGGKAGGTARRKR